MQGERIVHLHQFGHLVLLEADESLQVGCLLPGAAHAVNHVAFLLLSDEEDVEDFHFTLAAIVRRFVLSPPMKPYFDAFGFDKLQHLHTVSHRLH